MKQGICFINSAGHKYMLDFFDTFHPAVRERLRESTINICCYCLHEEAMQAERTSRPSPNAYFHVIQQFETGAAHDNRARNGRERRDCEIEGFRGIYETTYNSPFDFYDPRERKQRNAFDTAERELRRRMGEWRSPDSSFFSERSYAKGPTIENTPFNVQLKMKAFI